MKAFRLFAFIVMLFTLGKAQAQLTIEIVGGAGKQFPIAVVPFANESALPQSLTQIIGADLARSGLFRLVNASGVTPLPSEPSEINYADWRGRGADAMVVGRIKTLENGQLEIRFRVMDAVKQTQLAGAVLTASTAQLRTTAHRIADIIYEAITGDKGVFTTRIAYVVKQGKRYELQVSDADGFGAQTVLASNEPLLSPAWSPEGNQLAYVSFENKRPIVVVQNLSTGARRIVANFRGNNSAPAWLPDGRSLVVALSKDAISQLYVIPAGGGDAKRLTSSSGIDTEPTVSADGKWIAFLSDRGGSPQIYQIPSSGGDAQRLTFEGSYNASPDWSPDGKSITFIQRDEGRFRVALLELSTGQVQVLTDSSLDESPSFAPNGKMILYATQAGGRGVLATVSADGRVKSRLSATSGDIREPAWGPFPKN